jgi:hypothetical protein
MWKPLGMTVAATYFVDDVPVPHPFRLGDL